MNRIQEKLYQLLIEVDDICSRNDVTYYLAAGGALGAVRSGGFLPWDDDIDLYITRDNWEKLKKVMEKELPSNRAFICAENTDLYCNPIGRYVDKETTLMMQSQMLCGKCCGLLVEFFIMDPMPLADDGKWLHRKYMKVYTEILSPYFFLNREIFEHNVDFDFSLYNKYYWLSKIIGEKKTIQILLKKFANVPEDKSDTFCMRWGTRTVMFPSDALGSPKRVTFEGRAFPLVHNPERTFRIGYGDDWMYVPEGEGKIAHNLSNDLDEPFETYTNLYMPLLDKEKLLKAFKKRKRIAVKNVKKKELYEREYALIRAEQDAKYILKNIKSIEELHVLLKQKKFDCINDEFEEFYTKQMHVLFKQNDLIIPLPDEYLYVAIMNYILQGYYFKADKILKYRAKNNKQLSESLIKAEELIELCRELSIAIYDEKDVNKVAQILKDNIYYKDTIDFVRAKLWVLQQQANNQKDYEDLINVAREAIGDYGEDGELIKFEAYGLYKLGHLDESNARYCEAIRNTRNGFVWREAQDLLGIDAYNVADNYSEMEEDESNEE